MNNRVLRFNRQKGLKEYLRDADKRVQPLWLENGFGGQVSMEDRGVDKRYAEDSKGGDATATALEELLDAHELAGQLERLLGQEAETLKGFKNEKLLKILPQKELLVRELATKLSDFRKAKNGQPEVNQAPQYLSLKTCLRNIERLNRSNQAFVEGTLSHYRHFIGCLCPSGYHPRQANEPRQELAAFKGLTFRKEI